MRTSRGFLVEFVEDRWKALEIIGLYYKGPVKYAKAVLEKWPKSNGIVALIGGAAAGAEIFYKVDLLTPACVHYYIAVVPEHRNRGVATQIVQRVEKLCTAPVYMATTTEDNAAALRLFTKLGYTPHRWEDIPRRARDFLLKATCGYDDDVLFIKGADPREVAQRTNDVEKFWLETCLKPYLSL
ncbi:GNAT family N-acetyltransferase [Pyrobaculum aerophilum]|uniref:GNAT family N-acetyltransferase n=1 Tax=Pyrobaculum aerophilum TaxID=13773 RepID=UPI0023F13096|nr:GNAT family N-acetyltransferase [Pyrobaculum aerophilum]MCX8136294.1 GNAT family N-acetyltransferase [Pyrobaculum aerophilum]